MKTSKTLGIIAACISFATILVAAYYWFAETPESLAVGVDAFAKAIAVFWVLGIGFSIASTVAIIALLRGEPRKLPILIIAAESLIFVAFVISLALS